jgi:hypothetical protein
MDSTAQHSHGQAAPADHAAGRASHSREAIERSRTMVSASTDRLDRGQKGEFPAAVMVSMTLMEEIACIERGIAETLGDMATHDEGKTAARRRKLAADAIEGAHEADRRREQLQQLAERWSEHASVVTLRQLLGHAASVLTELARTEQDIADTFTGLARHDSSPLAAQRRQLAKAAAADAQDARNRAQDLHQLARASAASTRPH